MARHRAGALRAIKAERDGFLAQAAAERVAAAQAERRCVGAGRKRDTPEEAYCRSTLGIIIIIIPCKPYLSASATAPHPLGRRKVERLFSLFSV
jgi:hypothetical protein